MVGGHSSSRGCIEVSTINRVILHCSTTNEGTDVTAAMIRAWHKDRGWSDIGYHYIVRLDGTVESGRPINKRGSHVRGHNKDSIGICYVGGLDSNGHAKNTMTAQQRRSIETLCRSLCTALNKPLTLHGHSEFTRKDCPSFKVSDTFPELESWMKAPWGSA